MSTTIALTMSRRLVGSITLARDLLLVGAGSLVMAGLAQVSIPLPFTPVPITGQTLGVLLVGASLGSIRGAASMLLYLFEGGMGLPFFNGGASGFSVFAGPTGGYLIGFVFAAYVVGLLAERGLDRRFGSAVLAFAAGEAIVYLFGVPWLATFVGPDKALTAGFWPFLPGAIIKAALAGALLPSAWRAVGARDGGGADITGS
jgi:biotin transport system substrate-specific component